MKTISLVKIASAYEWLQVYALYLRAFPAAERKPFAIIRRMHKKGKTDVWIARLDGKFAGFAATINGEANVLLDYLAVDAAQRGTGVGSAMLKQLKNAYADRGLFVEIESVHKKNAPNLAERLRREQFYVRCGMTPMHVSARVFGVEMDLLGYDCRLDFAQYQNFYKANYSEFAAQNIQPVS